MRRSRVRALSIALHVLAVIRGSAGAVDPRRSQAQAAPRRQPPAAASRPVAVRGAALAIARPRSRRAIAGRRGQRQPAAGVLLRRDRRRRLEDDRRRARRGGPSPTSFFKTSSVGAVAVADVEPGRRLRRHGRDRAARQHHPGRRRLQVDRRRARPGRTSASRRRRRSRGSASTRPTPTSSTSPRSAIRTARIRSAASSRPTDGGKTWTKVLFRDDKTGAVDLAMDPKNPDVLYAGLWEVFRTPYSLSSGGPGSGLFKIHRRRRALDRDHEEPGPAEADLGQGRRDGLGRRRHPRLRHRRSRRTAASSCPTMPARTWKLVNDDRRLRQRAFYYTRIYADPKAKDTVYVLNTGIYRSTDAGKTLRGIRVPHGDNHDLWIAPNDPQAHDQRQRRRRQRLGQRRRDVDRPGLSRPRSSTTSSRRRTCRITSAARSRTTRTACVLEQRRRRRALRRRRRRERLHRAGSAATRTSSTPAATAGS